MCKEHGAAPPVFEERSGFLIDTFKAQMATAAVSEEGTQKSSQKGTQTSAQKILSLIEATPSITIEQLAAELGITDRAVIGDVATLITLAEDYRQSVERLAGREVECGGAHAPVPCRDQAA